MSVLPPLTERQRRYVEARATSPTITEAARLAGLSERHARRLEQQPQVRSAIQAQRDEVCQQSLDLLAVASSQAVAALPAALAALKSIVADTATPPAARAAAARVLLDAALRLVDASDLAAQLAALEERVAHAEKRSA